MGLVFLGRILLFLSFINGNELLTDLVVKVSLGAKYESLHFPVFPCFFKVVELGLRPHESVYF